MGSHFSVYASHFATNGILMCCPEVRLWLSALCQLNQSADSHRQIPLQIKSVFHSSIVSQPFISLMCFCQTHMAINSHYAHLYGKHTVWKYTIWAGRVHFISAVSQSCWSKVLRGRGLRGDGLSISINSTTGRLHTAEQHPPSKCLGFITASSSSSLSLRSASRSPHCQTRKKHSSLGCECNDHLSYGGRL